MRPILENLTICEDQRYRILETIVTVGRLKQYKICQIALGHRTDIRNNTVLHTFFIVVKSLFH